MIKKYKIIGKFISDMSSETKDVDTYIFVKDRITKYKLGIDISSKALKNKIIEVNTTIKFEEKMTQTWTDPHPTKTETPSQKGKRISIISKM